MGKGIFCPKCEIECVSYQDMQTVFECPKCGELRTTKSGGDVDVLRFRVGPQV